MFNRPVWLFLLPALLVAQENRITLDVIANDKSGKPVSELGQEAFTILDNKQPQKILSFSAVSNRDPAEVTIVIDSVNAPFTRVTFERQQVEKFLQKDGGRLAQPVSIALFSDSGLKIQGEPSRDGNALADLVDKNVNSLRTITRASGFYGAEERAQLSVTALHELIAFEAKRPGRKLVIWVSPGWPLLSGPHVQLSNKNQQFIFNNVVALSTLMRQERIALYAVDPLGTDESMARENYYRNFLKGKRRANETEYADLGLQVLAYQTGGRVLDANNDITELLTTCIHDLGNDYILTFDASPADGPNDYHAVEVKIAGPGLKAQTRTGYYAQPASR